MDGCGGWGGMVGMQIAGRIWDGFQLASRLESARFHVKLYGR
jgi:hypothetical protein